MERSATTPTTPPKGFSARQTIAARLTKRNLNSSNTHCPLLQLPPELRNRIYEACLLADGVIDVADKDEIEEPALLATCKEVRNEATAIFYGGNTFTHAEGQWEGAAYEWLYRIGEVKAAMVSSLELHCGMSGLRSLHVDRRISGWHLDQAEKEGVSRGRHLVKHLLSTCIRVTSISAHAVQGPGPRQLALARGWCATVQEDLLAAADGTHSARVLWAGMERVRGEDSDSEWFQQWWTGPHRPVSDSSSSVVVTGRPLLPFNSTSAMPRPAHHQGCVASLAVHETRGP